MSSHGDGADEIGAGLVAHRAERAGRPLIVDMGHERAVWRDEWGDARGVPALTVEWPLRLGGCVSPRNTQIPRRQPDGLRLAQATRLGTHGARVERAHAPLGSHAPATRWWNLTDEDPRTVAVEDAHTDVLEPPRRPADVGDALGVEDDESLLGDLVTLRHVLSSERPVVRQNV